MQKPSDILSSILSTSRRQRTPIWLVGGPVRDAILGRPCDDWDMVCRGAKKVARSVANILGAKFITLDEQYKIYRVIVPAPQITLDFAELQGPTIEKDLGRRDFTINAMAVPVEVFNRHSPRLLAGNPWIPCQWPQGMTGIIDPFGGQRDLKRKLIRAVSERIFAEDPLRLVRAFRFAAQFQFKIDTKTLRHVQKHRNGLSKVAAERIREELLRLWKQPHSAVAVRRMDGVRLLAQIFPEIEACRRTAVRYYGRGGVLKHSLQTVENLEWLINAVTPAGRKPGSSGVNVKATGFPLTTAGMTTQISAYLSLLIGGYPRSAWLKWAAFLHDIGKPATAKMIKGRLRFFEHEHVGARLAINVGQRLRCSRQEAQLLSLWVRNHMRPGNLAAAARVTDKALSRFFRDLGEDGVGMVLVSLADHYTYLAKSRWGKATDPVEKICRRLLKSYYEERSKVLPERLVDGHDLMRNLKLKPGPIIGQLLEKIQDAQVEGKVTTPQEALAFAKLSALSIQRSVKSKKYHS